MKPILYSKYRINARHIAEMMWGTGGTSSYRTNRRGAYYYSCSSHGGYVVDSRVLSQREIARIDRYIRPDMLRLYLAYEDTGHEKLDYVIAVSYDEFYNYKRYTSHTQTPFIRIPKGMRRLGWVDHPVYVFEEDVAWSVLELITDIKTIWRGEISEVLQEEHDIVARETFKRWYGYYKDEDDEDEKV